MYRSIKVTLRNMEMMVSETCWIYIMSLLVRKMIISKKNEAIYFELNFLSTVISDFFLKICKVQLRHLLIFESSSQTLVFFSS